MDFKYLNENCIWNDEQMGLWSKINFWKLLAKYYNVKLF